MAGKGDGRRRTLIDDDEFENNWNLAFRRNKQNEQKMLHKKKLRKEQRRDPGDQVEHGE